MYNWLHAVLVVAPDQDGWSDLVRQLCDLSVQIPRVIVVGRLRRGRFPSAYRLLARLGRLRRNHSGGVRVRMVRMVLAGWERLHQRSAG